MRKQHAPKATLFLMELVIVLFFFAICAAISVNVFGSAQKMAVDSDALSRAAMEVRSAASCYKAAEGDLQQTARQLNGDVTENNVYVYYNKDWKQVSEPVEAGYAMQIRQHDNEGEADIRVGRTYFYEAGSTEIFSIQVKTHTEKHREPQEGGTYETE